MKVALLALALGTLGLVATPAWSQDAVAAAAAPEAPPTQATAQGSAWKPFSSNTSSVYLLDMGTVTVDSGITRAQMARVSKTGPASDRSYALEQYYIRCGARQYRNPLSLEFGPDGRESDRYDDGGGAAASEGLWEAIRPNTNVDFIRGLVCERQEPNSSAFASIADYIAAGRP